MNTTNRTTPSRAILLAGFLLCRLNPGQMQAATDTWSGGSSGSTTNWTDPNNWVGLAAPAPNDYLVFKGANRVAASNDFTAGTIFGNIGFDSTAGAFTLGGNSLILTNGVDLGSGGTAGG